MDELLFFVYWFKHCRASRRWHSIVTIEDVNFVKWRLGVKTEFCPLVPGFCPGLSGILSCCDRFVSWFALNIEGLTLRSSAICSSRQPVKSDGDSAVVASLVPDVLVQITCLAREPKLEQHTHRREAIKGSLYTSIETVVRQVQVAQQGPAQGNREYFSGGCLGRRIEFFHEVSDRIRGTQGEDAVARVEDRRTGGGHLGLMTGTTDADHHDAFGTQIGFTQFLATVGAGVGDLQVGDFEPTHMFAGDLNKIFDSGMNHEAGDFDGTAAERTDDSIRTGMFDFLAGLVVAGASDDLKAGIQHPCGEDHVNVVGVSGEGCCEGSRPFDAGTFEDLVIGGVALDVVPVAGSAGLLQAFFIAVDDHELFFAFVQILTDGVSHPTEATHNVVTFQIGNCFLHASFLQNRTHLLAHNPLTELGDTVGENPQTKHEVENDKDFAVIRQRHRVFISDGGRGNHDHEQAIEPGSTFNHPNADRSENRKADQQNHDAEEVRKRLLLRAVGIQG